MPFIMSYLISPLEPGFKFTPFPHLTSVWLDLLAKSLITPRDKILHMLKITDFPDTYWFRQLVAFVNYDVA